MRRGGASFAPAILGTRPLHCLDLGCGLVRRVGAFLHVSRPQILRNRLVHVSRRPAIKAGCAHLAELVAEHIAAVRSQLHRRAAGLSVVLLELATEEAQRVQGDLELWGDTNERGACNS